MSDHFPSPKFNSSNRNRPDPPHKTKVKLVPHNAWSETHRRDRLAQCVVRSLIPCQIPEKYFGFPADSPPSVKTPIHGVVGRIRGRKNAAGNSSWDRNQIFVVVVTAGKPQRPQTRKLVTGSGIHPV